MHTANKWLKILPSVGFLMAFCVHADAAAATTPYVLPQLVFGGGWYSALYFANQNDTDASIGVYFVNSLGKPLLVPLGGGGTVSNTLVNVPAHGTAIVEAPNLAGLSQGYATFFLPDGVVGYGVFRQSVAGRADQEAVVPFTSATSTANTLVFDETSYITGIAIVNPSPVDSIIAVTALDDNGNTLGSATIPLAAYNKTVSQLTDIKGLSGIAGHRGTLNLSVAAGNVAALGLRFNGYAFTSIPLTTDALPPVSGFTSLRVTSLFLPLNSQQEYVNFTITPTNGGTTYAVAFEVEGLTLINGTATTNSSGTTYLFSTLMPVPNSWVPPNSGVYYSNVLSASMTLTVTQTSVDPATGAAVGQVSGLLTVNGVPIHGNVETLSGGIFGPYIQPAQPK
jgi:hypothetical protein